VSAHLRLSPAAWREANRAADRCPGREGQFFVALGAELAECRDDIAVEIALDEGAIKAALAAVMRRRLH
jgi:hypothetical protein